MKYSPDAALEKLRLWLLGDNKVKTTDAREILEDLDNWLTGGGPLPEEWARIRRMIGHGEGVK